MNKRDKAYKQGKTERFKSLRGLITFEIRNAKSTFYNEKVRPTRCACPNAWWTKINNIIGKKRNGISLMDPDTDSPMTDKQPAIYINSFFSGLTKDYPELINEWLTHESMEDLPTITVDDVEKKLRNINTKKAPGPNDPDTRILKTFAKYLPSLWLMYLMNPLHQDCFLKSGKLIKFAVFRKLRFVRQLTNSDQFL